jgi:putative ABC transport system substrate-binding protein
VKRREFITFLGSAAVAWPIWARAQPAGGPVIGFLGSLSAQLWARPLRAFHQGLGESGFVDGRNIRWT